MNKQLDLYPERAGFQDADTSKKAADDIEKTGRAAVLRKKVLALYEQGTFTADECAELLNEDILSIRPRVTELKEQGKLEDTGLRRENVRSGKKARVLRLRRGCTNANG